MLPETIVAVLKKEKQNELDKLIKATDYGGVAIKTRLLCLEYAILSQSPNLLQTANDFYQFVIRDYLDVSSPESSSTDKSL